MSDWQPIETAPTDVEHVRGLHVYSPNGSLVGFFYWAGYVDDESGRFYDCEGQHVGWESEDFTHWAELPAVSPEPPK